MKNQLKIEKCKSCMETLVMPQLVNLRRHQKKTLETIEKKEKQINYNLTFWLTKMNQYVMIENMTGEMLEDFKLQVVTGVPKNTIKKEIKREVLMLTNKSKINWVHKYWSKQTIVIMLLFKDQKLIWITSMPNQMKEDKSWKTEWLLPKRELGIKNHRIQMLINC